MKKIDARIVNSKKYLKEALLSLLSEMKISEIKVISLCQRAEINRATFYSHYNNVFELFDEIINEFMNEVCKFVSKLNENLSKEEKRIVYINLIKYIDKNSSLFILFFENSKNIELSNIQSESLQLKIRQKIKSNNEMLTKYIANYYIYSGGAILYTWLKNCKKESYEEISKILYAFVSKGVSFLSVNQ
jgi:AcrR family transcriptional regulator